MRIKSILLASSFVISFGGLLCAQQGGAPAQPAGTPKSVAPEDITGYWVSVITEDWAFRMVTPAKGDFTSLPLNPEGVKAGNTWDPAKDVAAGEQCKAYGAGGMMRMPVRLHITWQDEQTLKMEVDNGNQVRLFHFGNTTKAPADTSWQGFSAAEWETTREGLGQAAPAAALNGPRGFGGGGGGGRGGAGGGGGGAPGGGGVAGFINGAPITPNQLSGSLKVTTTKLRPGYLRRNGAPYSANAVMTEYYDRTVQPNGSEWLILTSSLNDPQYLTVPLLLTTHYKREPDGAKFNVRPCRVTAPVSVAK
jgi:hypothetical protein